MSNTMITAHSGCENTPDNSMESVYAGIRAGADCVEVDVRLDRDGALVLSHDRQQDYSGAVRLESVFRVTAEAGICVNCDLKEYAALYPCIALADALGIDSDHLVFSGSVEIGLLEKDPSIVERARIFLNQEEIWRYLTGVTGDDDQAEHDFYQQPENLDAVAAVVKRLGVTALNSHFGDMTREHIFDIRSRGMQLSLWTVNSHEEMVRLLSEDLVNLTTRRPVEALSVRGGL